MIPVNVEIGHDSETELWYVISSDVEGLTAKEKRYEDFIKIAKAQLVERIASVRPDYNGDPNTIDVRIVITR